MNSKLRAITNGATLAVLIILASSGAIQGFFAQTYVQTPPFFSVTLLTFIDLRESRLTPIAITRSLGNH